MGERCRNNQWTIQASSSGTYRYEAAQLAVLMDLRDELQKLNNLLGCSNFIRVPRTLRSIERQIKMQRRCPVHPRYTGAKPPRVDCRACRRFYKAVWK